MIADPGRAIAGTSLRTTVSVAHSERSERARLTPVRIPAGAFCEERTRRANAGRRIRTTRDERSEVKPSGGIRARVPERGGLRRDSRTTGRRSPVRRRYEGGRRRRRAARTGRREFPGADCRTSWWWTIREVGKRGSAPGTPPSSNSGRSAGPSNGISGSRGSNWRSVRGRRRPMRALEDGGTRHGPGEARSGRVRVSRAPGRRPPRAGVIVAPVDRGRSNASGGSLVRFPLPGSENTQCE
jgi:hypothetical protein